MDELSHPVDLVDLDLENGFTLYRSGQTLGKVILRTRIVLLDGRMPPL